jgi:hypothetical protein
MKKVVYLLGAGAIKGEMSHQGIESDITMKGIGENVLRLSRERNGKYWKMHEDFSIPEALDIELIMSLLEGYTGGASSGLKDVYNELRQLFRMYLITQITEKGVGSKIHCSLLHLHKNYGDAMGETGEEMTSVLTINYDSVVDEAFRMVHQGINYGHDFQSKNYRSNEAIPPLLKLHGSFNWKIEGNNLTVSKDFEKKEHENSYSGWIPPSVYKRPPGEIFPKIWDRAARLIMNCDILRVVGSSLRTEDLALLSLIFTSQLKSESIFNIELILPDKDAIGEEFTPEGVEPIEGIMPRLKFLGKAQNFSALPVFREESYFPENIFYSWVLMKLKEIEQNKGRALDDNLINRMLLLEV